MAIALDAKLLRVDQVQSRLVDHGAVIVNLTSGACFELNRIGSEIWELLDGGSAIGQICEVLGSRYPLAKGRLETDVRNLVDGLLAAGLIEQQSSATP